MILVRSKQYDSKKMMHRFIAGYLGIKKFDRLFIAAMIEGIQMIIVGAIDKMITGNLFGEDAVAGLSLLGPMDDICMLFQMLFTTGAAIRYSQAIAAYDTERARKIEGMSIFLTVMTGGVLFIASLFFSHLYFDTLEVTGQIRSYAEQYFVFSRFLFLFSPLSALLGELIIVDGDDRLVILTMAGEVVGNVFLSFILCHYIGIGGASLGSLLGVLFGLCLLWAHFFRRSNRLRPRFYFSMKETVEILWIGASDSISLLFDSVYDFFIRVWFIANYGMELVPVLAAVSVVSDLLYIGDGAGGAINSLLLAYRGDRNKIAAQNLLKHAIKVSCLFSLLFIGLICIFAEWIPFVLGIRYSVLKNLAVKGCRIRSIEVLPYMIIVMLVNYYLSIERYRLAVLVNALKAMVVRIGMVLVFSKVMGFHGIWFGSGLTSYVCLFILMILVVMRYGFDNFPFIDIDSSLNSININFYVTPKSAAGSSIKVSKFLKAHDVNSTTTMLASMAMEDVPMLIRDVNSGDDKKDMNIQIDSFTSIDEDGVRMVFWYDGKSFDSVNSDQIPSDLRAFVVDGIMGTTEKRNYMPTSGYNRISLLFPLRNEKAVV